MASDLIGTARPRQSSLLLTHSFDQRGELGFNSFAPGTAPDEPRLILYLSLGLLSCKGQAEPTIGQGSELAMSTLDTSCRRKP